MDFGGDGNICLTKEPSFQKFLTLILKVVLLALFFSPKMLQCAKLEEVELAATTKRRGVTDKTKEFPHQ